MLAPVETCFIKSDPDTFRFVDESTPNAEIKHETANIMNKFKCENCNFQTFSFVVFYKHECKSWELQLETQAEDCNIVPFNCANSLELYKCRFCDFCTNLKILLKSHFNQVHAADQISDSSTSLDLQKDFTCVKCKLQTCSVLVLHKHICTPMKHVKNEKQIMMLQCEFCNFKTKWKLSLQRHLRLIHPPGKWHQCKHCDYTFPQMIDLESHLLRMHSAENEKPFHCDLCDFKTKREDGLTSHLRLKHGKTTWFECEHCHSKFVKKLHLKKHKERQHAEKDIKWYQCDFCDYTTKYAAHMKKHLLCRHTNNRKIESHQCAHCEYKTELKSDLIKHLELEHLLKNSFKWSICVYCEQSFIQRSELAKHLAEQHSIVEKTGKRFHCQHCDYKTEYPHNLKAHMLRKHTDQQNINWFKCDHCEDKFLLKRALDDHLLKVHANTNEHWLHCDQCLYKTPFSWRLKDHILRRHTDHEVINWFRCEHCDFKTKMKTYLRLHVLRRHTPNEDINWVKCELCPYMGKEKINLKRHMVIKHGEEGEIV